ncbi:hypothetical protein ABFY60_11330 [Lysinibacillus pakistanensis]
MYVLYQYSLQNEIPKICKELAGFWKEKEMAKQIQLFDNKFNDHGESLAV